MAPDQWRSAAAVRGWLGKMGPTYPVTVPDIANPFFSLIIQGIEEAALRAGYAVVLGDTHPRRIHTGKQ